MALTPHCLYRDALTLNLNPIQLYIPILFHKYMEINHPMRLSNWHFKVLLPSYRSQLIHLHSKQTTFRNNLSHVFFKIGVLNNFANLTGKHQLESLFNKGLQAFNFIKRRHQLRCFPVKCKKFLRTPFLQNTSGGCFSASYMRVTLVLNGLKSFLLFPDKIFLINIHIYIIFIIQNSRFLLPDFDKAHVNQSFICPRNNSHLIHQHCAKNEVFH